MSNLFHDVKWEGADLFNGVNGNFVLQSTISSLLDEVIVDLACTEEDFADLGWVPGGCSIIEDHSLEFSTRSQKIK